MDSKYRAKYGQILDRMPEAIYATEQYLEYYFTQFCTAISEVWRQVILQGQQNK